MNLFPIIKIYTLSICDFQKILSNFSNLGKMSKAFFTFSFEHAAVIARVSPPPPILAIK